MINIIYSIYCILDNEFIARLQAEAQGKIKDGTQKWTKAQMDHLGRKMQRLGIYFLYCHYCIM